MTLADPLLPPDYGIFHNFLKKNFLNRFLREGFKNKKKSGIFQI